MPPVALRIVAEPRFTTRVRLTVPGQAEPAVIGVTFRHLGRRALRAWVESGRTPLPDGSLPSDVQWLGEVITGWGLAVDDDGNVLPEGGWMGPRDEENDPLYYSLAALDALLDLYQPAARELYDAYIGAIGESRAKN